MTAHERPSIDSSRPSVAGLAHVAQGGHARAIDHRTVADFATRWPDVVASGPAQRAALVRAVRYVAEHGIRQFLDIGCGKPSLDGRNLHQLATDIQPDAHWLYTDADPEIRAIGHATLSSPNTGYLQADARDITDILGNDLTRKLINFSEPVCVILYNVWHYIPDDEDTAATTRAYLEQMPSGSALILAHALTDGLLPELHTDLHEVFSRSFTGGFWPRPRAYVEKFFDGLDLAEPGLVVPEHWHPEGEPTSPCRLPVVLGVAFKR